VPGVRGLAAAVCVATVSAQAQDADFFEKRVRPVLANNCHACHSAKAKSPFANLRLDSLDAMLRGGDHGPAIVPGDPAASRLVQAIRHVGLRMPPSGKLAPAEIEAIEAWIASGAPWPDSGSAPTGAVDVAKRSPDHWAWQPVRAPRPGATIDSLAKPGAAASRRTLIRRAHYDLTGLPPTFADLEAFERDTAPDAWPRLVDRLLESPHFGERWARHWLDLARYADAGVRSVKFAYAHSYRDWVIDALNRDLPYNRFVQLQLAADQIDGAPPRDQAALGFLTLGLNPIRRTDLAEKVDDRIDVVTRGLLGLTVSCARCHDHKFDPIPTADYYSLYGVFANSEEPFNPPHFDTGPNDFYRRSLAHRRAALDNYLAERLGEMTAEFREPATVERYKAAVAESRGMGGAQIDALAKERNLNLYVLRRWRAKIVDGADVDPPAVPISEYWQIATEGDFNTMSELTWNFQTLLAHRAYRDRVPGAMALVDSPTPSPARVFIRGNKEDPGPEVPRRFLAVLSKGERAPFPRGSGRLDLAAATTDPSNPLTARVMANRVWQRLFGEGIVATPSDFGTRGDPPTNPELLDLLAHGFMADHWSVKRLIRRIMLSDAYRQRERPARRMDFESLRDGMLAASGLLSPTIGGPSFTIAAVPPDPRRTLYAFVERQRAEAVLKNFDFADPESHTPQRFTTTVPQQALFLMNSPFVAHQARHLAARAASSDPRERINAMYRAALARRATEAEERRALEFVRGRRADSPPTPVEQWRYGWGTPIDFQPFAFFADDAWQAASMLPHVRAGMASLTAGGGHPGDDARSSAIRRFVVPEDGEALVTGLVSHVLNQFEDRFKIGNGIRASIVSSRSGKAGEWELLNSKAEANARIPVRAGDTIDFVVESKDDYDADKFTWAPVVELNGRRFDARAEFRGPLAQPLTGWEQFAQVLLLSNEFAFVD
jgi:mono/diheme cytochrome c family protein